MRNYNLWAPILSPWRDDLRVVRLFERNEEFSSFQKKHHLDVYLKSIMMFS